MNKRNLKPFKKGNSGNPGGRPKWKHITEILRKEDNLDRLNMVVDKVFEMALTGNMRAIEFIADRLEGKPRQYMDFQMENDDRRDRPIKVFDIPGLDSTRMIAEATQNLIDRRDDDEE